MKLRNKPPVLGDDELEDMEYNPEDIYSIHEFGIDIDGCQLSLLGDPIFQIGAGTHDGQDMDEAAIGYVVANRFIKNLQILQNIYGGEDKPPPVIIHMNTHGGSWTSGMAIYNAIRHSSLDTVVVNYGESRSMSSIIPLAADMFVMMPHSTRYMFHRGYVSYEGTGTNFHTFYREYVKQEQEMLDIYVHAMSRKHGCMADKPDTIKREWLVNQMNLHEDAYLSPEEAVAYGFAHEIFDGDWDRLREPFQEDSTDQEH